MEQKQQRARSACKAPIKLSPYLLRRRLLSLLISSSSSSLFSGGGREPPSHAGSWRACSHHSARLQLAGRDPLASLITSPARASALTLQVNSDRRDDEDAHQWQHPPSGHGHGARRPPGAQREVRCRGWRATGGGTAGGAPAPRQLGQGLELRPHPSKFTDHALGGRCEAEEQERRRRRRRRRLIKEKKRREKLIAISLQSTRYKTGTIANEQKDWKRSWFCFEF